MLATFGLERLESTFTLRDTDDEVAELIERAAPAARAEAPRANLAGLGLHDDEPGLPTRVCRHGERNQERLDGGNPQFQPTRQANRV